MRVAYTDDRNDEVYHLGSGNMKMEERRLHSVLLETKTELGFSIRVELTHSEIDDLWRANIRSIIATKQNEQKRRERLSQAVTIPNKWSINIPEEDDRGIEELYLPVSVYNILIRSGVHTLKDLAKYNSLDIRGFYGFGKLSEVDLINALKIANVGMIIEEELSNA